MSNSGIFSSLYPEINELSALLYDYINAATRGEDFKRIDEVTEFLDMLTSSKPERIIPIAILQLKQRLSFDAKKFASLLENIKKSKPNENDIKLLEGFCQQLHSVGLGVFNRLHEH